MIIIDRVVKDTEHELETKRYCCEVKVCYKEKFFKAKAFGRTPHQATDHAFEELFLMLLGDGNEA